MGAGTPPPKNPVFSISDLSSAGACLEEPQPTSVAAYFESSIPSVLSPGAKPSELTVLASLPSDGPSLPDVSCSSNANVSCSSPHNVGVPCFSSQKAVEALDCCGSSQCQGLPKGSRPCFKSSTIELVYQVYSSGVPNRDGLQIPLVDHSLNHEAWDAWLGHYFDKTDIVESVKFGWDLGLDANPSPRDARNNHPSANEFDSHVQAYIDAELGFGALAGPYDEGDFPFPVAACPLGTVPKTGSDTRRTITDCTFSGFGINEWISKQTYRGQPWNLRLPGIDNIVTMVENCRKEYPGEDIVLFKLDLSRYYRNWRVCPGNIPYLAIRWRGKIFLDLSYSFGNRAAMLGSQRASDGLAWIFRTQVSPSPGTQNSGANCQCVSKCGCGDNKCVAYVDDFIGACRQADSAFLWDQFLRLLSHLGLKPSETAGHLCPPASCIVGLGILIDVQKNTLSIPTGKLEKAIVLLKDWACRTSASRRQIQQLLGKLLHLSRVVRPGRLFVNRMLETLRRAERLDTFVPLPTDFHDDVLWWLRNIQHWNGISFLRFTQYHNKITLDASTNGYWNGRAGIGGFNFIRNEYFRCTVPDNYTLLRIEDLELVAHLLAARVWGWSWSGLEIHGKTDSEPCEYLLRHGKSRSPHRLSMSRLFCELQQQFCFLWVPDGIRSKDNILADCLSRWSVLERRNTFYNTLASEGRLSAKRVEILPHHFNITSL